MKILIIANTRFKGGLSGSDAIYESFVKFWPHSIRVWCISDIDYKPFFLCYLHRIFLSCFMAFFEPHKYDFVYTTSDFLPDSLAGFIFKCNGNKWVAGFFLKAFKENKIHYWTQKFVRWLITKYADMVVVTNPTMYPIFPDKKKTWINGGIDLSLAGLSDEHKIYDAVFCGRIHPSKGIDELIEIWELVRKKKPNARLALIGDGDLGKDYIKHKLFSRYGLNQYNGIDLLGYMGDERFKIYKQSIIVLYPTPLKYDHFSIAPVEAMACGCPMVCFNTKIIKEINPEGCSYAIDIKDFSEIIISYLNCLWTDEEFLFSDSDDAYKWAKKFDYQKQSLRVLTEIEKGLYENTCNRL